MIFIVNLGLVEKVSYITYVVFPICLMIFIWPVVVAWSWGNGWLFDIMKSPMIDVGGSVTIYTFAGAFALAGAFISSSREHRFTHPIQFQIINGEMYVLGAFLTILGVFGMGWVQQSGGGVIAMANL